MQMEPGCPDQFYIVNTFSPCPIEHPLCHDLAAKRNSLPLIASRVPEGKTQAIILESLSSLG